MKIEFIKNFFTKPDEIHKSTLGFNIEMTQGERNQLFDDSVDRVAAEKIAEAIERSLIVGQYGEEVVKQTEDFISLWMDDDTFNYVGGARREYQSVFKALVEKYPKAMVNISQYDSLKSLLIFDVSDFSKAVAKKHVKELRKYGG